MNLRENKFLKAFDENLDLCLVRINLKVFNVHDTFFQANFTTTVKNINLKSNILNKRFEKLFTDIIINSLKRRKFEF